MAGELAVAYVTIRPRVDGFDAAARAQVGRNLQGVRTEARRTGQELSRTGRDAERFARGAAAANAASLGLARSLTFASTAFIGGAGLGVLIHTATNEFEEMTRVGAATVALLRSTGGAAHVSAAEIDELSNRLLRQAGIDDELTKASANVLLSFRKVRNEAGAGNDIFNRTLGLGADIATVFRTDLTGATLQLGKALEDPVRGITALRRSGISFTQAQREQIKALVESGQQLRAQRILLAEVERQVGGTAVAVGSTLPGQLDVLRERAKNALGDFVKQLSESEDAASAASGGAAVLSEAWRGLSGVVSTVGPPLLSTARAAAQAAEALDPHALLAAVVAYKALGIGIGLTNRVQGVYVRASQIAVGSTAEQTVAMRVGTTAAGQYGFALRGVATGNVLVARTAGPAAAGIAATGIAARSAAVGAGAGRLALAALGGTTGAVTLGLAGVAFGLFKLRQRAQEAPGTLRATASALNDLNDAVERGQRIRERIAAAGEVVTESRLDVRDARSALDDAIRAEARSKAQQGSLEQLALSDKVRVAQNKLREAEEKLRAEEFRRTRAIDEQVRSEQQRGNVVSNTTRKLLDQLDAARKQQRIVQGPLGIPIGIRLKLDTFSAERQLREFRENMEGLSTSGDHIDRVLGRALLGFAAALDRIPSRKEVELSVRLAGAGATPGGILSELGIGLSRAQKAAQNGIEEARSNAKAAAADENRLLLEQVLALQAQLKIQRDKVKERKAEFVVARQEADASREARAQAEEALRASREQLSSARRSLADTIRSTNEAVNDSVSDAKQNLRSLADAVADALARMNAEQEQAVSPELRRRIAELRSQVLAGGAGPETQRAAAEIQARLARPETGDDTAERARRRLADLSDQFNRGQITAADFNRRLNGLLRDFHFDSAAFAREFGSAARNELVEQIAGLRRQASAIAVGPQRPGGGTSPDIVRPLQAVADAQREVADAQRGVREAIRSVAQARDAVGKAQLEETKAIAASNKRQETLARATNRKLDTLARLQRARNDPAAGRKKKLPVGAGIEDARSAGSIQ